MELVCEERWSHLAFVNERPASERSTTSSEFIGYMVDHVADMQPLYGDNIVSNRSIAGGRKLIPMRTVSSDTF